jgi:hypothetical protein
MYESRRLALTVIGAALVALSACARPPADEYRVSLTVEDIMNAIVDPASDAIWGSVEVVATLEGTVEKQPRTDEDWTTLRRHTLTLMEAGNLLLMPGRRVAKPGEKAEDPRVDRHPEEIEALIARDRAVWIAHAHELQAAAAATLAAIEARNVKALVEAGETLDLACETCHKTYWYKPSPEPVNDPPPRPEH